MRLYKPIPNSIYSVIENDFSANGRIALWKWMCRYLRWTIEKNLEIKTQEGGLKPLILNNIQRRALARICWQLYVQKKPVRWIWMKSRRMGVSMLVLAVIFVLTRFQRNRSALLMSNKSDTAEDLFKMCKLFDEKIGKVAEDDEDHPLYLPKRNNRGRLLQWCDYDPEMDEFNREGGSLIRITSAGTELGAAGSAFQFIHYSEIGDDSVNWKDNAQVNDICVPTEPGTIIIREGTTYLEENSRSLTGAYLQHEWELAQNGESGFTPVFDAWWEFEDYRIPLEPGEEIKPTGSTQALLERDEADIEEVKKEAWEKWRIDKMADDERDRAVRIINEALKWRRDIGLKIKAKGDLDWFHSQYPKNPIEAFVSKAQNYFNGAELNSRMGFIIKNRIKPIREMKNLSIWHEPEEGTDYLITADPSSGKGGDYAAAIVFNVNKFRDEAVWHGKEEPHNQAKEWADLGRTYSHIVKKPGYDVGNVEPALLCLEVNTGYGTDIAHRLETDYKYPRIYRPRLIDKRRFHYQSKINIGFHTSDVTREIALAQLKAQWMSWETSDLRIIKQMLNFGYNSRGKPEALTGGDEFVTCYWIRAFICNQNNWISDRDWHDKWVDKYIDEEPKDPHELMDYLTDKKTALMNSCNVMFSFEIKNEIDAIDLRLQALRNIVASETRRRQPWRAKARALRSSGQVTYLKFRGQE